MPPADKMIGISDFLRRLCNNRSLIVFNNRQWGRPWYWSDNGAGNEGATELLTVAIHAADPYICCPIAEMSWSVGRLPRGLDLRLETRTHQLQYVADVIQALLKDLAPKLPASAIAPIIAIGAVPLWRECFVAGPAIRHHNLLWRAVVAKRLGILTPRIPRNQFMFKNRTLIISQSDDTMMIHKLKKKKNVSL